MGYSNYWNWDGIKNKEDVDLLLKKVNKILKKHKDIIRKEYNQDLPAVCSEKCILFNGIGDDGHETFYFRLSGDWNFCKTARKPYDEVVWEVLKAVKKLFPDKISISNDDC